MPATRPYKWWEKEGKKQNSKKNLQWKNVAYFAVAEHSIVNGNLIGLIAYRVAGKRNDYLAYFQNEAKIENTFYNL